MKEKENGGILRASFLLDGEDRVLEGNRDAEILLERPLEEVRKMPLQAANPALYSSLKDLLAKTKRGRGVENYALAYKVGKQLMRLNVSIAPYPLEALGVTGSLVSITTAGARPARVRKEVEVAGAAGVETRKPVTAPAADPLSLMDHLGEPAFLLDAEAVFLRANEAMCRLLGHDREDVLGRPMAFFLAGEEAKKALEYLGETVHAGPWRGELEFHRPDGSTSWMLATVSLWEEEGKRCLLGVGTDFTVQARVNREREEELKRVWTLLENAEAALVCFTPDHRITLLSRSAERLLGTTRDRAIGAALPELFPAEARQEVAAILDRAVSGERVEGVEVSLVKKGRRVLSLSTKPAFVETERAREYMLLLRDVTRELSEAEKAERMLEASRCGERVLEQATRSASSQEFLERCLAVLEEEIGGKASAAFVFKGDAAHLAASRNLSGDEERTLREMRLRAGYARLCEKLKRLTVEIHGGVPRKGWEEVLSCLERADLLIPVFRERRWRNLLVLPLRGKEDLLGAVAIAEPEGEKISALGKEHLEALREAIGLGLAALREREERTSEGEGRETREGSGNDGPVEGALFTPPERDEGTAQGSRGGMAGSAGPSSRGDQPGARAQEHDYFEVAREVKGSMEIPDNLPLWTEGEGEKVVPSPRGINIAEMLMDLKDYYSRSGRKGDVFLELEDDLPKLHTDRRMLREALMCLLDNAFKFSPPGTPVVLGAERWGDEIVLRVEDQGPGIPAEVVREIMHGEEEGGGEGASLKSGLHLCRRYVKAMGGELVLKGKEGEGTTASIRLRLLSFLSNNH